MNCRKCKYWGSGDGKVEFQYDAGGACYCNHPSICGNQHMAYEETKVYIDGTPAGQVIMTRRDFGCVLFEGF